MRHLDLFSGIGGFALAVEWVWGANHELIGFCEIDKFCQKVLKKHWPNTHIFEDIKTLTGDEIGSIDIVTGGFPCQPFSQAGKRRGKEDDRHLWPEYLRIIQETRPRWVVGENVAGIINMELDQVLSDLEGADYSCQSVVIPACAVNAPHRRDRVWIIAHSNDTGTGQQLRTDNGKERDIRGNETSNVSEGCVESNAPYAGLFGQEKRQEQTTGIEQCGEVYTNTPGPRLEGKMRKEQQGDGGRFAPQDRGKFDSWDENWIEIATEFCGVDARIPNRVDRLKSLGNAIVPQVAYEIFMAIKTIDDRRFYA